MKYQVTIKNPTGETRIDTMTNLLFVAYSTETGNPVLIAGDSFEYSDMAAMLYAVKHCYKDLYKKQNRIVKKMVRLYARHRFWENLKNKLFGIKEDNE